VQRHYPSARKRITQRTTPAPEPAFPGLRSRTCGSRSAGGRDPGGVCSRITDSRGRCRLERSHRPGVGRCPSTVRRSPSRRPDWVMWHSGRPSLRLSCSGRPPQRPESVRRSWRRRLHVARHTPLPSSAGIRSWRSASQAGPQRRLDARPDARLTLARRTQARRCRRRPSGSSRRRSRRPRSRSSRCSSCVRVAASGPAPCSPPSPWPGSQLRRSGPPGWRPSSRSASGSRATACRRDSSSSRSPRAQPTRSHAAGTGSSTSPTIQRSTGRG
jgi:hypothetical protein